MKRRKRPSYWKDDDKIKESSRRGKDQKEPDIDIDIDYETSTNFTKQQEKKKGEEKEDEKEVSDIRLDVGKEVVYLVIGGGVAGVRTVEELISLFILEGYKIFENGYPHIDISQGEEKEETTALEEEEEESKNHKQKQKKSKEKEEDNMEPKVKIKIKILLLCPTPWIKVSHQINSYGYTFEELAIECHDGRSWFEEKRKNIIPLADNIHLEAYFIQDKVINLDVKTKEVICESGRKLKCNYCFVCSGARPKIDLLPHIFLSSSSSSLSSSLLSLSHPSSPSLGQPVSHDCQVPSNPSGSLESESSLRPTPSFLLKRILTLRDMQSIQYFSQQLCKKDIETICIVGNGGIAMEAVYELSSRGKDVIWIIRENFIGNPFLDATGASCLLHHLGRSREVEIIGQDPNAFKIQSTNLSISKMTTAPNTKRKENRKKARRERYERESSEREGDKTKRVLHVYRDKRQEEYGVEERYGKEGEGERMEEQERQEKCRKGEEEHESEGEDQALSELENIELQEQQMKMNMKPNTNYGFIERQGGPSMGPEWKSYLYSIDYKDTTDATEKGKGKRKNGHPLMKSKLNTGKITIVMNTCIRNVDEKVKGKARVGYEKERNERNIPIPIDLDRDGSIGEAELESAKNKVLLSVERLPLDLDDSSNNSMLSREAKEENKNGNSTNLSSFEGDILLVATGVIPETNFLTDPLVIKTTEGAIVVNERYQAINVEWLYAVGDCCSTNVIQNQEEIKKKPVANLNLPHLSHFLKKQNQKYCSSYNSTSNDDEDINKHKWIQMRLWTQAVAMGTYAARCALKLEEEYGGPLSLQVFSHATTFFGLKVVLLGCFNGQTFLDPKTRVVCQQINLSLRHQQQKQQQQQQQQEQEQDDKERTENDKNEDDDDKNKANDEIILTHIGFNGEEKSTMTEMEVSTTSTFEEEMSKVLILFRFSPSRNEYVKLILMKGKVIGALLIGETDLDEVLESLLISGTDVSFLTTKILDPDLDLGEFFD